jgi:hypothetical protein
MHKIELRDALATDLDRDGRDELIATVWLRAPAAAHQMFVIARRRGEAHQLDLIQPYIQRDLVDGTDTQYEQFVDQLDLNGDGKDEVVTLVWFYESNEYRSYTRYPEQDGGYQLYHGGGGGC